MCQLSYQKLKLNACKKPCITVPKIIIYVSDGFHFRATLSKLFHLQFNFNLDITVELRALGVPWTLHCWMHALAAAHELRLDAVIDQLLQDFLQVCPDDYSSQFVTECLPLLFNIFRYSKVRGP